MTAKFKKFIVVSMGNTNGYAHDEYSLPVLLELMDSCGPDHRMPTAKGVMGHFRSSKRRLEKVRRLVARTEALKARDARFAQLKIGVAEGDLTGEFDWLGRVKSYDFLNLFGLANLDAMRSETDPETCAEQLRSIAENPRRKQADSLPVVYAKSAVTRRFTFLKRGTSGQSRPTAPVF